MSFVILAVVANNPRFQFLGDTLHLGDNPVLRILNADLALVVVEVALALVFRVGPYSHPLGLQFDDFPSLGILRLSSLDEPKLLVTLNEFCPVLEGYRRLLGLSPISRPRNVQVVSGDGVTCREKN